MPTLKRLCPGCKRAVVTSGRCPGCQRRRDQARDAARGSASRRGYTSRWREIARLVVRRDPVCTLCGERPSTEADHIIPKAQGGSDDVSNLRGTCKPCNAGRR